MPLCLLRYDLRRSPDGASYSEIYKTALEQVKWGDDLGLDIVTVSEHHFTEDGFCPSPLVFASAVAAATRRISINVSALLPALHHPLRLAEDCVVLDQVSRGRTTFILGLGYRDVEFDGFGVEKKTRARRLERAVEVLRQAFSGEPFDYEGTQVQVLPTPYSRGGPLLLIGGSSEISARRAARLKCGFMPSIRDERLEEVYLQTCAELGHQPGLVMLPSKTPAFMHVSDDPERDWPRIAKHALHDAMTYASWQEPGARSQVHSLAGSLEELRAEGKYVVWTPDEVIEFAKTLSPLGGIVLSPLMGGMDPDLGWESLELFKSQVFPQIQAINATEGPSATREALDPRPDGAQV